MTNSKQEELTSGSDSDSETIEVQVAKARQRAKGVPAHKETGKKVQAKGVAAKKAQGAASTRERELARLAKKNDQAERLARIEEKERAEKERAELLAANASKAPRQTKQDGDLDTRFARLEALIMSRNAESQAESKGKSKAKPKRKPSSAQVGPKVQESSDEEEEEPPRQKAVRKSAKAELKRKVGAQEEELNHKGHLVNNKGKKQAMELDHERAFMSLASNLLPGRF